MTSIAEQRALCERLGLPWVAAPAHAKVGIAHNVRLGIQPLHDLRHPPQGDTTGWYIWAGEEPSADPSFFEAMHVVHLGEYCPLALRFLGLPPGWRFLTDGEYEDIWEDPTLLGV